MDNIGLYRVIQGYIGIIENGNYYLSFRVDIGSLDGSGEI